MTSKWTDLENKLFFQYVEEKGNDKEALKPKKILENCPQIQKTENQIKNKISNSGIVKKEANPLIQNHSLPTSVYSQIIGGFGSDKSCSTNPS
jgi:HD-GYP domain-containing protein (c-di-GMP phosphodiesterase class II)